ncbi:hypothetical protein BC833DRAFT_583537 [Globomyces pollinis-pini]|nr:hypothetical protein BC833DRAFT_583537 [Globomyces pollinis-pini]
MPLTRSLFAIFSSGFALAIMFRQLIIVLSNTLNIIHLSMIFNWILYIFLQLVNQWSNLEKRPITNFTYVNSTSTIFYSIALCMVFYTSVDRFLAINNQIYGYKYIRFGSYGLLVVLLGSRLIRTVLIYIQNSGSSLFPASNYIQLATILVIFFLKLCFDAASFGTLKRVLTQKTKGGIGNLKVTQVRALMQLRMTLVVELSLTIISWVVATLEAYSYTGDNLAFMDWLLISWCIAAYIDQKPLLQRLFDVNYTSGISHQ